MNKTLYNISPVGGQVPPLTMPVGANDHLCNK